MDNWNDLRWGQTTAGDKLHALHPGTKAEPGAKALCGQVLANIGPPDESWDYGGEAACGRCQSVRQRALDGLLR